MSSRYFNYTFQEAENRWDRWIFARRWLDFYSGDPRWIPPFYTDFRHALEPGAFQHLDRLSLRLLTATALPRPASAGPHAAWPVTFRPPGAIEEVCISTAILGTDPRNPGGPASLVSLHCANDAESLERTLDQLLEAAADSGHIGLVGPTGFSPYLGTGILESHWDTLPPLHTPYHPPYLAELIAASMDRLGSARLYTLDPEATDPPAHPVGDLFIDSFDPAQLAGDLLPLFIASCPPPWPGCPPPDAEETAFVFSWVRRWPLTGLLARTGEQPIGFVLLQPDQSNRLRRASGGRGLLRQAWLSWTASSPVAEGRLLFGGVLPGWRGQGVGAALLARAVQVARANGWRCLNTSPVPDGSPGAKFLLSHGALPQQLYGLYWSGKS